MLQFVFHPAAYLYQLVPMQNQLPQITLLPVRRPQLRKPPFHHQFQNMSRVPFVGLLLAHVTGPDLRRISDPDFVSQVLHQFDEPLTVAGRFHADQRRRRQLLIKHLGVPSCVHQFLRATLPSLRVQPRHLLPAGMDITSYNHHAKAPSSLGALVLKPRLPGRSSLRSYPISPNFTWAGFLMFAHHRLDGARWPTMMHFSSLTPYYVTRTISLHVIRTTYYAGRYLCCERPKRMLRWLILAGSRSRPC